MTRIVCAGTVAVLALLAFSAPAHAAPGDPIQTVPASAYRLHADWSEDALATRLRATVDRSGAPTLATLMGSLTQSTTSCNASQRGALPENWTGTGTPPATLDSGGRYFCWDTADSEVSYWTPQGITGSYDGALKGALEGQTFTTVSWYYDGTAAGRRDPNPPAAPYTDKGARVSFVNADHTRYRSVLLVEPTSASNFRPVPIHAAGISLAGHYLYVTALSGGLHVFDLDKLMTVTTGRHTVIGKSGSAWYAYGYRYVLPQVARYTPVGPSIEYSSLDLDRSTTPDTMVVSEYSRSAGGRILSFPVDRDTRKLIATGSTVTAVRAVRMPVTNVQGAMSFDGVYYMGSSAGAFFSYFNAGSAGSTPTEYGWTIGGEDFYHQHTYAGGDAQPGLLWSLTEHAYCDWTGASCGTPASNARLDRRIVFAIPLSEFD